MNHQSLHPFAKLLILAGQQNISLMGNVPSEEELGALLDGKLDKTRALEIYAYLNADPKLFSHWIGLVETQTLVDPEAFAEPFGEEQRAKEKSPSFFSRLFGLNWITIGTGAVTSVFLVLLSVNSIFYSDNVEPTLSFSSSNASTSDDSELIETFTVVVKQVEKDCESMMEGQANQELYIDFIESYSIEFRRRQIEIFQEKTLYGDALLDAEPDICIFNRDVLSKLEE